MSLTQDEVRHISRLARLELTDKEVEKFTGQLSAILEHSKMLDEVDTSTVEPVAQITGIENIHHADGRVACEKADALLEQSPQGIRDHMIQVKNVF